MKTLWSFGDSFAHSRGHFNVQYENEWLTALTRNLEGYLHHSTGQPGTSLEFVYARFLSLYKAMNDGDVVIICMTSNTRKWYWEDRPCESAFVGYNPRCSAEENKALQYYEMYLNKNPQLSNLQLYYFLYTLNNVSKEKNLKTVILSSYNEIPTDFIEEFTNIHFAKGFLIADICIKELDPSLDVTEFLSNDHRHNHMIVSNHLILADKVTDYIKNGVDVDMTTGFKEHILNYEIVKEKDFIKNELFGSIWQPKA